MFVCDVCVVKVGQNTINVIIIFVINFFSIGDGTNKAVTELHTFGETIIFLFILHLELCPYLGVDFNHYVNMCYHFPF